MFQIYSGGARLVEHSADNREAMGSNPIATTKASQVLLAAREFCNLEGSVQDRGEAPNITRKYNDTKI